MFRHAISILILVLMMAVPAMAQEATTVEVPAVSTFAHNNGTYDITFNIPQVARYFTWTTDNLTVHGAEVSAGGRKTINTKLFAAGYAVLTFKTGVDGSIVTQWNVWPMEKTDDCQGHNMGSTWPAIWLENSGITAVFSTSAITQVVDSLEDPIADFSGWQMSYNKTADVVDGVCIPDNAFEFLPITIGINPPADSTYGQPAVCPVVFENHTPECFFLWDQQNLVLISQLSEQDTATHYFYFDGRWLPGKSMSAFQIEYFWWQDNDYVRLVLALYEFGSPDHDLVFWSLSEGERQDSPNSALAVLNADGGIEAVDGEFSAPLVYELQKIIH